MNNKRGSVWGIIYIVGALFILLFVGVLFALGSGVLSLVSDTITPELTNLGVVGDWNASQTNSMVFNPIDTVIQSSTWLGGILIIFGIIAIFGLAFAYRNYAKKWMIPLFFGLMLLLIICSIFISTNYEQFYSDGTDIGTRLQNQVVLSNMILYSPAILTIIGFIAGAIMFSGATTEGEE